MSNKTEKCAFENLTPISSTAFQQEKPDSKPMTEARPVTHYELDARLSATEARMDARIDRIEATVEVIRKGSEKILRDNENMRKEIREEMKAIRTDVRAETNSAKREFRAISFGLLLAMLTTVFAVMQINSSLISGTISAVQHGIATSEQAQDMRKMMEVTISEVQDIRKELAAARSLKNQAARNN